MDTTRNPYIQTPINLTPTISDNQTEEIINTRGAQQTPPAASDLKAMTDNIAKLLLEPIRTRGDRSNELIRELRVKEKEREQRDRIREQEAREAEERRIKMKKATPKKREREEEHRPLAIGAHGLARQDGADMKGVQSPNLPLVSRGVRRVTKSLEGATDAPYT
jgi:transcriptional adapter 3